jgi:hypothetical protein
LRLMQEHADEELNVKKIRSMVEGELKCDLTDRRAWVRELVYALIAEHFTDEATEGRSSGGGGGAATTIPTTAPTLCASCGKSEAESGATHRACSRCKGPFYCGVKCQKQHWKHGGVGDWTRPHKQDCGSADDSAGGNSRSSSSGSSGGSSSGSSGGGSSKDARAAAKPAAHPAAKVEEEQEPPPEGQILVQPEKGYLIKAFYFGKIFFNVVTSEKIQEASQSVGHQGERLLYMPASLPNSSKRFEKDKSGSIVPTWDVVVHPKTLKNMKEEKNCEISIVQIALHHVHRQAMEQVSPADRSEYPESSAPEYRVVRGCSYKSGEPRAFYLSVPKQKEGRGGKDGSFGLGGGGGGDRSRNGSNIGAARSEAEQHTAQLQTEEGNYLIYEERSSKEKISFLPEKGFVVQAYTAGVRVKWKMFMNVVSSEKIDVPQMMMDDQCAPQMMMSLFLEKGKMRVEKDKSGSEAAIWDVCVHPDVMKLIREQKEYEDSVVKAALNAVENDFNRSTEGDAKLELSGSYQIVRGCSYKGELRTMCINTKDGAAAEFNEPVRNQEGGSKKKGGSALQQTDE